MSDISDEVSVNLNNILFDGVDHKLCNLSDRVETGAFTNFTKIIENIIIQFIIIYTSHRL